MQVLPALSQLLTCLQAGCRLTAPEWWRRVDPERRKWIFGLLCIVCVALIWVVASFVVQEVEDEGLHPFLLSYIANSLFVVYLPLHFLASKATPQRPKRQ